MAFFAAAPFIAAATAISAVGQLYQGFSQGRAYSAAADNANANARNTRLQSSANEDRERRAARMQQGSLRAAAAETGFDPSTGSLADLQARNAGELELDILTERYRGELSALSFENEARSLKSQARAARTSGVLSAAGTIFGGAQSAAARQLPGFTGIGSSPY